MIKYIAYEILSSLPIRDYSLTRVACPDTVLSSLVLRATAHVESVRDDALREMCNTVYSVTELCVLLLDGPVSCAEIYLN